MRVWEVGSPPVLNGAWETFPEVPQVLKDTFDNCTIPDCSLSTSRAHLLQASSEI